MNGTTQDALLQRNLLTLLDWTGYSFEQSTGDMQVLFPSAGGVISDQELVLGIMEALDGCQPDAFSEYESGMEEETLPTRGYVSRLKH